jgi:pimeloyl-ACP methyl ester carboxylesterase
MSASIMKRLLSLIVVLLCAQLAFSSPVQSAPAEPQRVKELNFVFLHGAGGNACNSQLLSDIIAEQIPRYISEYERDHPDTEVRFDMLRRCYPSDVDIHSWAMNIADSIDKYFPDRENLIFIGHSAGGKAALYAVAQNIGGLADKTAMVVTINSPIQPLERYYVTGGGSALDYCRLRWLLSDEGICNSVVYYDSSQDGYRISYKKRWLAFISGEAAPLSEQFDIGGVDAAPRDMDDGVIPMSAQYTEDADVIYYGEYGHSDFAVMPDVAGFIADRILHYIFGGDIACSVLTRGGSFEHEADWLLGKDSWQDFVGEVLADSGSLEYKNDSIFKWQEWEEVLGECPPEGKRSSYQVRLETALPFLTGVRELRWFDPDNPEDCRIFLRTRVAPGSQAKIDWSTRWQGLLPEGIERDRYEVEIVTGTPLTDIDDVSWATDNPRDLRMMISSEAESPFRWFKAQWRAYSKENRYRKVIDETSTYFVPEATASD